jgi:hypothetical protein
MRFLFTASVVINFKPPVGEGLARFLQRERERERERERRRRITLIKITRVHARVETCKNKSIPSDYFIFPGLSRWEKIF